MVPDPAKPQSAPFVTVMSASSKSVVLSEDVNVKDKVASSEESPSLTSAAVIVMVGGVVSAVVFVQLNWSAAVLLFPAASVNVLPATSMVHAPSPVGVKVAV